MDLWRHHSKTIVTIIAGAALSLTARLTWPNGGADFDLVAMVGGILLAFGLQGVIDYHFVEVAKPEAPPRCPPDGE